MQENEPVQQFVFVAPLLPGKRESYVRFVQEMLGQRREAYEASRQNLGVTRERFWLLETAGPSAAVTALTLREAAPIEALSALINDRQPFGRWLQRQLLELHGLGLHEKTSVQEKGRPHKRSWLPQLIAEWTAPAFQDGRKKTPATNSKGGN